MDPISSDPSEMIEATRSGYETARPLQDHVMDQSQSSLRDGSSSFTNDQPAPSSGQPIHAWNPAPPAYTTDAPPAYGVPSFPYKPPYYGAPVVIQPGGNSHGDECVIRVQGVTLTQDHVPVTKPESYMCLALFTCLLCNWILGSVAIYYSARSKKAPNYQLAQSRASVSFVLSMIGIFSGIIIYITVLVVVLN